MLVDEIPGTIGMKTLQSIVREKNFVQQVEFHILCN